MMIRTGLNYIPFHENFRIALDNLQAGRPLFEGQLPARRIPDPRFPESEWIEIVEVGELE